MKKLLSISLYIITFLFCIFLITNFATAHVVGVSMYPTYNEGDILLIKRVNKVNRGDIVIVWSDKLNEYICKRIIGLPNDIIKITNNELYINKIKQDEQYINETMDNQSDLVTFVEKDSVFVMGDNRNLSLDSREIGSIKQENIKGVVLLNLTKTLHYNKVSILILVVLWFFFIFLVRDLKIGRSKSSNRKEKSDMEN